MLGVEIKNGGGDDIRAIVNKEGALNVAEQIKDTPPVGSANRHRYFNALVGSGGADTGITDMRVDGSVTPQEFFIKSQAEYDIRITKIVIILAGIKNNVILSQFGGLPDIAVGWDLKVTEEDVDTFLINKAKTNGQVLAQSATDLAWGTGTTEFRLDNWTGTDDAIMAVIPVSDIIPDGLRIGRGTLDRITSVVNDDLTGANFTEFTVRVIGYRHYPIS